MGRLCAPLLSLAAYRLLQASGAACPGTVAVDGYDTVSIVPTGWGKPGDGKEVQVLSNGHIRVNMGGRAYFADTCTAGTYNHNQYTAHNLLGKTMRYTTDMSKAGCGCNAALYLTSLRQNTEISTCSDYYCDANKVCGVWCAEIDIQEANQFAWHSTLHTAHDRSGVGAGYGGGGSGWSGPRQWTKLEYGPGEKCIDSSKPFQVAASFPVDSMGMLVGMEIVLSQEGRHCPLSVDIDSYKGMADLSKALEAGMTPIVSYWKANDMLWMDGRGKDGKGPCATDDMDACPKSVQFYDFSVEKYVNHTKAAGSSAAAVDGDSQGFCCLASSDSDDMCGKCFPAAKARQGTRCGGSEASCQACGGNAQWCVPPAEEPQAVADEFCCLAAPDSGDFCGGCFPAAKARGGPCGRSEAGCQSCGGRARWCSSPLPVAAARGEAPPAADEDAFCCLAARSDSDACGTCFPAAKARKGNHCGNKTGCHACGGKAWCQGKGAPPSASAAGGGRDTDEGGSSFCCLAAASQGDACGTCFSAAKAGPGSHCGRSQASCRACHGHATWCEAPPSRFELANPSDGSATEMARVRGSNTPPVIHAEAAEIPAGLAEGAEATIVIGDAPPVHVRVVKMS